MNFQFTFLNKTTAAEILPELFDILADNMSKIAPIGNNYEEDQRRWLSAISDAIQKEPRQIILIWHGSSLVGFFMYYISVSGETFMMEEIQCKPEYHGTGVFRQLYHFMFSHIPDTVTTVEAFANKQNTKSQGILCHLGLTCIGKNKTERTYHYRGAYQKMKEMLS